MNFLMVKAETADLELLIAELPSELTQLINSRITLNRRGANKVSIRLTHAEVNLIVEAAGKALIRRGLNEEWVPNALGMRLEETIGIFAGVLGQSSTSSGDGVQKADLDLPRSHSA